MKKVWKKALGAVLTFAVVIFCLIGFATAAQAVADSEVTVTGKYGYNFLATEENGQNMQALYYDMYLASETFAQSQVDLVDSMTIASFDLTGYALSADEAVSVWKLFGLENPEYYWLSNTISFSDTELQLNVHSDYADHSVRSGYDQQIADMISAFQAGITADMDEMEIALAAHDFIINRIDYAYESDGITPKTDAWAHNIVGAAASKGGVCECYAKTFMLLCLDNEVNCMMVTGSGNGEAHAWNLVEADGSWYGVDVTWDDPTGSEPTYGCFGMSEEALNAGHTADSSQSFGIDYLYDLPQVSAAPLQPVELYQDGVLAGTCKNIDDALSRMTDSSSTYTVELNMTGVTYEVNTAQWPAVQKIILKGTVSFYENDYFSVTSMTLQSDVTLNSDLELHDISVRFAQNPIKMDLQHHTLSTHGYYCSIETRDHISGTKTGQAHSAIRVYTTYLTEVYSEVDVHTVACEPGCEILMRGAATMEEASGTLRLDGFDPSDYAIGTYWVDGTTVSILYLSGETGDIEIGSIRLKAEGSHSQLIITNIFGKLEEFHNLTITGSIECEVSYTLLGQVQYQLTDMAGNVIDEWTETCDPWDLIGPIITVRDEESRDQLTVECGGTTIDANMSEWDETGALTIKPLDVIRLAGGHRWATALKVADEMKDNLGVRKFDAIIVASGNDFADALAGSYLSTVKDAPILLSWGKGDKFEYLDTDNIDYIKANLAEDGTVYLLGGEGAVPELYDVELAQFNMVRLGGDNRFETNLMILEEAGIADGSEILVCTSTNFADSLSASATGKPILLVFNESGKLYGDQPEFLAGLKNCTFTVIGGEKAVSEKLATAIGAYGKVTRLAGADRFDTSVMVAQKYFEAPETAVLAYAWSFPDGLCGGALAHSMDAPLILTMTKYEAKAAAYAKEAGITQGIVLGGDKLISDAAVRAIFSMDADDVILVK